MPQIPSSGDSESCIGCNSPGFANCSQSCHWVTYHLQFEGTARNSGLIAY